ncbi:hypothetical protein ANANG_G00112290 [Anguilla anguilla]|uniref:Uncharacterized protein n=1 Tax=Anguilla anguilla TaxID=7936 RepID=A0A9D3MLM6_ANGAN|nr:hypothetical protein ANANG_G00112290 [Anguilla anguilla]
MASVLSVLVLLLLWLGTQLPCKASQCYVPICGAKSNEACDYIALNFSSGKWTASWAERPCRVTGGWSWRRPEEVRTQLVTSLILISGALPLLSPGLAEADGNSTSVPGPLLLRQYLLAWVKWVMESVPEDWWPGSELSLWLTLTGMAVRTVLEVLIYLASNWETVRSIRNMLQTITQKLAAIGRVFFWVTGGVNALYWWVRGHPRPSSGTIPQDVKVVLEEKIRTLELQVETLQRTLAAKEQELTNSQPFQCGRVEPQDRLRVDQRHGW